MSNLKLIESLLKFSRELGQNVRFIQGPGGNTSVKYDDTLLVKASGKWLSDACSKNIFAEVDLPSLQSALASEPFELNFQNFQNNKLSSSLVPSIETGLHAILPDKFVVHSHPVDVISFAIRKDAERQLQSFLLDFNWKFIPYYRPGLPLTKAILNANLSGDKKVFVLGNHGLITTGRSMKEAVELTYKIAKKCNEALGSSLDVPEEFVEGIRCSVQGYRPVKFSHCHMLAYNERFFDIVKKGYLFPDQVIFLGNNLMIHEGARFGPASDNTPGVVIQKDMGVFVREGISEASELMLLCLFQTLSSITEEAELRFLTDEEVYKLTNWDAEKLRKELNK